MILRFFDLVGRCWRIAAPYGQWRLFGITALILINGLLQLVGVTSIFPFFALAADPERLYRSDLGSRLLALLPPLSHSELLFWAGAASIFLLFVASASSLASDVIRMRYAYNLEHFLRSQLFRSYARRPYAFFAERNTAEILQKSANISIFTQSVLIPIGEVLTRTVLAVFLTLAVFWVQPAVTAVAIVALCLYYLLIFRLLRPRSERLGEAMKQLYVALSKHSLQFVAGIKPSMAHEKTDFFAGKVLEQSKQMARWLAKLPVYNSGPRYLLEPIAFGGLVLVVMLYLGRGQSFADILPNLSVLALAAYRLIPALQLIYGQLITINSWKYVVPLIEEEVVRENAAVLPEENEVRPVPALALRDALVVQNLGFRYPGADKDTLSDFSLVVRKGESVGIVGTTGCGKSTLADLLLGLREPCSGSILVDGWRLDRDSLPGWRRSVGYVSQEIYLLDDTVAANIAFGVDASEIDGAALREAARKAQILDFIENELGAGFETFVGERGVRLSGGQRQRIGLARALYHRPSLLILDEATSALDTATEARVMETIRGLQGEVTMLIIAHRLSTLEGCSQIIDLGSVQRETMVGC